jgi:AcrR family transcriptional regulator
MVNAVAAKAVPVFSNRCLRERPDSDSDMLGKISSADYTIITHAKPEVLAMLWSVPEERREELMNAAQRLFLEDGVGPASIEQITEGADVAKGTFYLHFASKDDVLLALRERFIREFLNVFKVAIAKRPEQDWKGKLAAWAKAGIAGYLDRAALHDIVFHEYQPRSPKEPGDSIVIAHLSGMLEAGAAAGAWSLDDPRFTATLLFHGLHGVVHDALAKKKPVARSPLIAKIQRACFRAVGLPSEMGAGCLDSTGVLKNSG